MSNNPNSRLNFRESRTNYSFDRYYNITNDSGQISIDFLVGFTIFIIGFIFVITLMSGLLVGLQSKTIDYDAVAYRTGVILVEDLARFKKALLRINGNSSM